MSISRLLYNASTGAAATDASVDLVSAWLPSKVGQPVSFQAFYGAGLTGDWSLEGTNADPPVFASSYTPVSASLLWQVPTQPTGSAGSTSLQCQATHDAMRIRYTVTSGGDDVLPVVQAGVGSGAVLVIPPDVAVSPASSSASLAALVVIKPKLSAIVDSYDLGWAPGEEVCNEAIAGQAVQVSDLSSAKRYRISVKADALAGEANWFEIKPNGATSGICWYIRQNLGTAASALMYLGNIFVGDGKRTFEAIIHPRKNGISSYEVLAASDTNMNPSDVWYLTGSTTVDFTSLTFDFADALRTGWITVIEESP